MKLLADLVDFRREDEVVLGQAASGVREKVDRHRAVADQQVGMVALGLGDWSDLVGELDGRHEALELVALGEAHVAFRVFDGPAVELLQELPDLVAGEWGSARLALDAMSLVEGFGLGRHRDDRKALGRMVTPAGREQAHIWAASSAGERLPHTQEVVGSNPTPPTTGSWPRRLVD